MSALLGVSEYGCYVGVGCVGVSFGTGLVAFLSNDCN